MRYHIYLKIMILFQFLPPPIHKQASFAMEQEFIQRRWILCHPLTPQSSLLLCCTGGQQLKQSPPPLLWLSAPWVKTSHSLWWPCSFGVLCLMPTLTIWDLCDAFGTGRWLPPPPARQQIRGNLNWVVTDRQAVNPLGLRAARGNIPFLTQRPGDQIQDFIYSSYH